MKTESKYNSIYTYIIRKS